MSKHGNGMVHYKSYVAGWLDSSVRDFLRHSPSASKAMKYTLITSLDSNPAPRLLLDTSPQLRSLAEYARPLKSGIVVPTEVVRDIDARNRIFFGFDEVWFFPDEKIEPKPGEVWLVGPRRIDQEKLERLGSWMADNGCSLGLGDGDGLNFIVKARGLVRYLLGYSMLQPQPTAAGHAEC